MTIVDYVMSHTDRGECNCGRCLDRGDKPDPTGHVADVFFFKVAAKSSPTKADFKSLARQHKGSYGAVDPFDGKEHSYIELGGWIGDQGVAMQFMGLGALLGLFRLMTPKMLPGLPADLMSQMAGAGMVSIQAI